jgi:hypothetical protein
MKISPDLGPVSTPDTWPGDAESAHVARARHPTDADAIRTSPIDSCSGHDSAEPLLMLEVRLETLPDAPLPHHEERASAVQALAHYIFEPLSSEVASPK